MGLFGNNTTSENEARRVVSEEERLLAYRRRIVSTLGDLNRDIGLLNKDLESTNTALASLIGNPSFSLPRDKATVRSHLSKLVRTYNAVARLKKNGEPIEIGEAAKKIVASLIEISSAVDKDQFKTKQELAAQLERVFSANKNLSTYLTNEGSRIYAELETQTRLLRRA